MTHRATDPRAQITPEDEAEARARYEEMMGWDRPRAERADIAKKLAGGASVRVVRAP